MDAVYSTVLVPILKESAEVSEIPPMKNLLETGSCLGKRVMDLKTKKSLLLQFCLVQRQDREERSPERAENAGEGDSGPEGEEGRS